MPYRCVKLEVPDTQKNLLSYQVSDVVGPMTLRVVLHIDQSRDHENLRALENHPHPIPGEVEMQFYN